MKSHLMQVTDSTAFLKNVPDNTFTACVTDGPYGISFMNSAWDTFNPEVLREKIETNKSTFQGKEVRRPACEAGRYNRDLESNRAFQAWCESWASEVLRTVKPGGILLSFCGPRTYHRMVAGIEDAGWIVKDTMMWIYGSGFPKSHNIGNSVDKQLGCSNRGHAISSGNKYHPSTGIARASGDKLSKYQGRTQEGSIWEGYGTALKPAYEPIVLAMKPLDGTYANNALTWGVSGINIDETRIENNDRELYGISGDEGKTKVSCYKDRERVSYVPNELGRWPSNILLEQYSRGYLDAQADENISRFFYCSKSSKAEREAGLSDFESFQVNDGRKSEIDNAYQRGETRRKNIHPTVKPLSVMRYLVKLVKMPKDNHILDLFMGSGTTGCACALEGIEEFTGLDKTPDYLPIAEARIKHWEKVSVRGKDFDELQGDLFNAVCS